MSTSRLVWIALAVFVAIYLAFLGVRPLIVPDEHRYAAIGLEMIDRGDFTVPRLIGFRYFEKPAGGAHLVAIAVEAVGRNAFAYRLPSAFGAGLAALLLALAVSRATGRGGIGALAAIAFSTMVMPAIVGTTVILDAPFAGFVTASLVLAWLGLESPRRDLRLGLLALAGPAAGCPARAALPLLPDTTPRADVVDVAMTTAPAVSTSAGMPARPRSPRHQFRPHKTRGALVA